MADHPQPIQCRCFDCGQKYPSKAKFATHFCPSFKPDDDARVSSHETRKTCRYCKTIFAGRNDYTRHMPNCASQPGGRKTGPKPTNPAQPRPRVAASEPSEVSYPVQHVETDQTPFEIQVGAKNAKVCEAEIERRVAEVREYYAAKCDNVSKEVERRVDQRTAELENELTGLMISVEETRQIHTKELQLAVEEAKKSAMKLLEKARQESQKAAVAMEGKCALKIAHAKNVHEHQVQKLRQDYETKLEQCREEMHACHNRAMEDLRWNQERDMSNIKIEHAQEIELVKDEYEVRHLANKTGVIPDEMITAAYETEIEQLRQEHTAEMVKIKDEHQDDLEVMNDEIERLEKLVLEYEKSSDSGYASHVVSDAATTPPSDIPTPSPKPCSAPSRGYRPTYGSTTGDVVTIFVGPPKTQEEFRIDRSYLTEVSSIFEGTLKAEMQKIPGQFEEPQAEMKIYDFPLPTFKIFRDWLLGRRLPARFRNVEVDLIEMSDEIAPQTELLNVYIFATEYDVPQLRRDALDAYIVWCVETKTLPSVEELEMAHDSLPPESPMVRFMIDVYAYQWNGSAEQAGIWKDLPEDFIRTLIEASAKFKQQKKHVFNNCDYHEH